MPSAWVQEPEHLPESPFSSDSSLDEDEVNRRLTPHWASYQTVFKIRGFRLETVRDVKDFYKEHSMHHGPELSSSHAGYLRLYEGQDDNALCPDAGLVRISVLLPGYSSDNISETICSEVFVFAMGEELW